MINRLKGELAEDFVHKRILDLFGITGPVVSIIKGHEWHDFLINEKLYLEVKSCELSRKWCAPSNVRVGTFEFIRPEQRFKLIELDAWIAFVVRHGEEMLLLGFVPARLCKLQLRKMLSIHEVIKLKPLTVTEFVKVIT